MDDAQKQPYELPELMSYHAGWDPSFCRKQPDRENREPGSCHAAVILFLSRKKEGPRVREDSYLAPAPSEAGSEYHGIQTEDAPIQYMVDYIAGQGRKLKKVLCITSYDTITETFGQQEEGGITAFSRFKELVRECVRKNGAAAADECEIHEIPYDYYRDENGSPVKYRLQTQKPNPLSGELSGSQGSDNPEKVTAEKQMSLIFRNIAEILNGYTYPVYVDYTSGLRDTSLMMTTIIRFLEFSGHSCEKIVYSNYFDSPKRIVDIHFIYDMFQMINGTSEFISYGSAKQLMHLFENADVSSSARELVKALGVFSETIRLNKVGDVDDAVKKVVNCISDFSESDEGQKLYDELLRYLLPTIKNKLYIDTGVVDESRDRLIIRLPSGEEQVHYPTLIRWCVDNDLLQQALTLYVEKMPIFYFQKRLISTIVDLDDAENWMNAASLRKPGSSKESIGFFTELYETIRLLGSEEKEHRMADFLSALISMKEEYTRCEEYRKQERKLLGREKKRQWLDQLVHKHLSGQFGEGPYRRLIRILENYLAYDPEPLKIYGEPVKEKNMESFLNALLNSGSLKYRHYLLFHDRNAYTAYQEEHKKNSSTYVKRINALEALRLGKIATEVLSGQQDLFMIMAYYLAIKIIRNLMNHASEGNVEDSQHMSEAAEYLDGLKGQSGNGNCLWVCLPDGGKKYYSLCMNNDIVMTSENITRLLYDALEISLLANPGILRKEDSSDAGGDGCRQYQT